jgi:hypothetical protein
VNKRKINFLLCVFIIFFSFPASCYAAAATYKLLDELTEVWLNNPEELNTICEQGKKLNKDVFSFWNPIFASKRVEAFSEHINEIRLYVSKPQELDKDTISAFADAKEAALLRAMRKRCPDVW